MSPKGPSERWTRQQGKAWPKWIDGEGLVVGGSERVR